jgi:uncharacterized protein (UPF0332 family)
MDKNISRLLRLAGESIQGARVLLKENFPGQSASRAYYAMFYVAQALLWSSGVSFSKHSAVIARFGQEFAKTKKLDPIYHRYLRDGFEKRQIADYGATEDITRRQASELILHARKFLREAKTFLRQSKSS